MTSFPVCKKTLFSRKRCIKEVKFPLNTNRKSGLLFQNTSIDIAYGALERKYNDDVIFGLQENLIMSETVHIMEEKLLWNFNTGSHGRPCSESVFDFIYCS